MLIVKRLWKWYQTIKPRYFLSLDGKVYNEKNRTNCYRFKSFGEHNFPTFSYQDIIKNTGILYSIEPSELIGIAIDHHLNEEKNNKLIVSESLRGNKYKLTNNHYNEIITGDEICQSPELLEKLSVLNVYKIAYNTGFIHGRQFSKELIADTAEPKQKAQIHALKLVSKN